MNDWYIDRSKNFVNPSLIPVLEFLLGYEGEYDSASIISAFVDNDIFDQDSGNLNAALTRFRDHGLITNHNQLGQSSFDFVAGKITLEELILDLLFKRSAKKKNSPNVKPLVLLCVVFDLMYDLLADDDDIYLTFDECYKYLYNCNSVEDITIDYVDAIINNRIGNSSDCLLKQNDITNLSIWVNALKNTPIFISTESKTIIKPNRYARSFLRFVSINGKNISQTPTHSNAELYEYFTNRNTGLTEIIPDPFKPNVIFQNQKEAVIIFNYIMGIKIEPEFNFKKYFEIDCFGIFNPFLYLPGLAIRRVWIDNKIIGESLFKVINQ